MLPGPCGATLRRCVPPPLTARPGTADDQEFNFWVEPPVQAQWITDGLKIGEQLRRKDVLIGEDAQSFEVLAMLQLASRVLKLLVRYKEF